jgi:nicotinic acid mononucleotide adenylyltransferase
VEERLVDGVLSQLVLRDRVTVFPIEPHPISSTEIREQVAAGVDVTPLVGPAVAEQIRQLGLYTRVSAS